MGQKMTQKAVKWSILIKMKENRMGAGPHNLQNKDGSKMTEKEKNITLCYSCTKENRTVLLTVHLEAMEVSYIKPVFTQKKAL